MTHAVAIALLLAAILTETQPMQVQDAESAAVVQAGSGKEDPLSVLASEGRWEDLVDLASERLSRDENDALSLYWNARAEIQRGLPLIGGRAFARDLGRTMLRRAEEQLARVTENPADATSDARNWAAYARYLREDDESLPADLEAWFGESGRGYAAFLRGLIARNQGDAEGARSWLARAVASNPERGDFEVELATELGRAGRTDEAVVAWNAAVSGGLPLPALLAALLEILPGPENSAQRLTLLDSLVVDDTTRRDGLLAWYRSWSLEQLGRPAEGAAALDAATDYRTPELERAHASLLVGLGRRSEAAEHLRTAAEEGDAQALSDLVSLGDWYATNHAWDEALAVYDDSLRIEPRDERAAMNRALAMAQSGRSLDAWLELADRMPGRADILNNAALQLQGWRRDSEARAMLESAALLPGGQDAAQNLADMLLNSYPADPSRALALIEGLNDDAVRDWALYLRHVAHRSNSR